MAKILIVEDDLAFGTMIQTWLRKKGFEVERATSVKAALHFLKTTVTGTWYCPTSDSRIMMGSLFCNGSKTRLLHSFHRHDQLCRSSECCSRHEIGRY